MSEPDSNISHLRNLRENARQPVRERARQRRISHINMVAWEKPGRVVKPELLPHMSPILGVSVDEVLGQPNRSSGVPIELGQIFEEATNSSRRQQLQIVEFIEPVIRERTREMATAR